MLWLGSSSQPGFQQTNLRNWFLLTGADHAKYWFLLLAAAAICCACAIAIDCENWVRI